MNRRFSTRVFAVSFGLLVLVLPRVFAQQQKVTHHHYKLIDLGTFGGPRSIVNIEPWQNFINSNGTIVGGADTSTPTPEPACYNPVNASDCLISHAFIWRGDDLKDLGTLPGGNFSFAESVDQFGQIAGTSETAQIDPASGNPEFHAVFWQNDKILDLGTLGGTSSFAESMNDFGQVTGVALNSIPDPFSLLGLGSGAALTQTHGFIWQSGKMQDLGTLGGPDSWAVFINNAGQIAGTSYTSDVVDASTGTPPVGVFIWQKGKMKDIGNLGGNNGLIGAYSIVNGFNNFGQITGAMEAPGDQAIHTFLWNGEKLSDLGTLGGSGSFGRGISDTGEVVGLAALPGDQVFHGFLWQKGATTDLGTLGGDPCSDALNVNSNGQVVGASLSACQEWTTAFLWENDGPMVDLNSLVTPSLGAHLGAGLETNANGEIVAVGFPPGCHQSDICTHIYGLIPCDTNHPNVAGCDYSLVEDLTAGEIGAQRIMKPSVAAGTRKLSAKEMLSRTHSPLALRYLQFRPALRP